MPESFRYFRVYGPLAGAEHYRYDPSDGVVSEHRVRRYETGMWVRTGYRDLHEFLTTQPSRQPIEIDEHDAPCPFCDVLADRCPAKVVRKWDDAWAIEARPALVPGHLLIIPTWHVPDAAADPIASAMTARRAAELAVSLDYPHWHDAINVGRRAGRTVPHLHRYLWPRCEGDGLRMPWDHQTFPGT